MNVYVENAIKINTDEILSYKIKKTKDYHKGGFYLIKHKRSGKMYVGKSIDYLARLKQHTYKSNDKSLIDFVIKTEEIESFEFYLLANYNDLKINFFTRKLETIIEHRLITFLDSRFPNGFNERHYGHL